MKVPFHKQIYSPDALREATAAFEGVARVEVSEEGDYLVADLQAEDAQALDEVAGEFKNYVLGETISLRGRQ